MPIAGRKYIGIERIVYAQIEDDDRRIEADRPVSGIYWNSTNLTWNERRREKPHGTSLMFLSDDFIIRCKTHSYLSENCKIFAD